MNLFISPTQKGTKEFPTHRHTDFEIAFYPLNTGILRTTKKVYQFYPGCIVIIPPGTAHSTISDTDINAIYIRGNFSQLLHLDEPMVVCDNKNGEGNQLINLIYKNRFGNKEYTSSLCNAFIHFLVMNIKFEDDISKAVMDIISEISTHALEWDINITDILKARGYAEDYIRAQFKKTTEKTPTEFLTHIRIDHARFLIETYGSAMTLSQIAEKCGYIDYVYFSRRFKQITGMSPRKFMTETIIDKKQ